MPGQKKSKKNNNRGGPPSAPKKSSGSNKKGYRPDQRYFFWVLLAGLAIIWIISNQGGLFGGPPVVDYSSFKKQLNEGNVKQLTIQGDKISGELKQKAALKATAKDTAQSKNFVTYLPYSYGKSKDLA